MLASVFGEWVDVSPKTEVWEPVWGLYPPSSATLGWVGWWLLMGGENSCTVSPSDVHHLHDTRAIAFLRLSINKVNIGITQGYRSGGVPMKRSARRCATRHGASCALEHNPEQP